MTNEPFLEQVPLNRSEVSPLRRSVESTRIGVVIPAHNEEDVISTTLRTLLADARPSEFQVIVVCNGCSDATALRAREVSADIQVVELAAASKVAAVRTGSSMLSAGPRIQLDADVDLPTPSARALADAVRGQVLAAGPRRTLERSRASLIVRWYYDIWEQLPQVKSGLFGRGVIALSGEGQRRVDQLPPVLSDDLAISEAFRDEEYVLVQEAVVVVYIPRSTIDLLRRRVRVITGNHQADALGLRRSGSETTGSSLASICIRSPRMIVRVPVFLFVTGAARLWARRAIDTRDFDTWQRDDSSRARPSE